MLSLGCQEVRDPALCTHTNTHTRTMHFVSWMESTTVDVLRVKEFPKRKASKPKPIFKMYP